MDTGIEDEGELGTEERKEVMFWEVNHGTTHVQEGLLGKGVRFSTMRHTRFQGRARRERTLLASRR